MDSIKNNKAKTSHNTNQVKYHGPVDNTENNDRFVRVNVKKYYTDTGTTTEESSIVNLNCPVVYNNYIDSSVYVKGLEPMPRHLIKPNYVSREDYFMEQKGYLQINIWMNVLNLKHKEFILIYVFIK